MLAVIGGHRIADHLARVIDVDGAVWSENAPGSA